MRSSGERTSLPPEGVTVHEGATDARGLRAAIVVSRYHDAVTGRLLDGAVGTLLQAGAEPSAIEVFYVPGSFELPLVTRRAAASGRFQLVVVLGCVIKGETIHDRVIADEVTRAMGETMRDTGIPVGFGLLTVDDLAQADERSGGRLGNKGEEAALAALRVHHVLRRVGG